jgi:Major Facilitator Superfamily
MPSPSALDTPYKPDNNTHDHTHSNTHDNIFRNRNYLFHWAGTALVSFADYFTLIAMPWLVLMLTNDAAALGIVMALESLPRAVFMLVSGGISDRYTARKVLFFSRGLFMLALIALAVSLLTGTMQIHILYGFALILGLLSALSIPAATALLPQLVEEQQIQKGNSALMGTRQLIQLFAPLLAGLLIWGVSTPVPKSSGSNVSQMAYAFLISAAAILLSSIMLLNIKVTSHTNTNSTDAVRLADGFLYLWQDRGLCIVTVYMACISFFAVGPIMTVIPQFADQRLHSGALSFGLLYTVNGIGALIGYVGGGMLPKPKAQHLGLTLFTANLIAGIGVLWLGFSFSFTMAAPALVLIGITNSISIILSISWIQGRIPLTLSGRVIGIVMFASMGLTPVSMTLSGLVSAHFSLTILLCISGGAIITFSLLGLAIPSIYRFATYAKPE